MINPIKNIILGFCIISTIAIGYVDYVTDPQISFSILCVIPVLFVAWLGPYPLGMAVSVAGALAWSAADFSPGISHPGSGLIPTWNVVMRILIFMFMAYLTGRFRDELSPGKTAREDKFDLFNYIIYKSMERKGGSGIFVLAVFLTIILAVTDYVSGYEISFSIFYFIPILIATWFGSILQGVIVSVLSAVMWGAADLASGHRYPNLIIPLWNDAMRLLIFLLLVHLSGGLKRVLSAGKDARAYKPVLTDIILADGGLKNPAFPIVFVMILGVTDYLTGYEISFSIFYFIPILFATWFGSFSLGTAVAVLSAVAWGAADLASGHKYADLIIPLWNAVMRLLIFLILAYLAGELKRLLRFEKELSRRKSDFVSNVAHEFNNPLAVVGIYLNVLYDGKAGDISPEQKRMIGMCVKNVERLGRMSNDLLEVSRIEAGKMVLRKEKLDMALLSNDILAYYERELSDKGIRLVKDIRQEISPVMGDRDKLTEVIINLLSNAIKYAPDSTLTVTLTSGEDGVRFEISDTGPGIPREYLEKIFDKFERVSYAGREGTGLGLSIARDIVELHGGKIWAESAPGEGSKFIFTLPKGY